MSFGGGFSGGRKGLRGISGSHGQVLRFHQGKKAVIGSNDFIIDNDTGDIGLTGSLSLKGNLSHSGSITPESSEDLGASSSKYSNVHTDNISTTNLYTGDLHMKNERGDWTIFEESNSLIAQNNLTGERFKLAMEKIED